MNKLLTLIFVTGLLFAPISQATVIFDVTVNYSDNYQYIFAMEFDDDTGLKSESDLISTGPAYDFTGEVLIKSGITWTLEQDFAVSNLFFDPSDPSTLSFLSVDVFSDPTQIIGDRRLTTAITDDALTFTTYNKDAEGPISVTKRVESVPEPSILALLSLGLAGVVAARRKIRT